MVPPSMAIQLYAALRSSAELAGTSWPQVLVASGHRHAVECIGHCHRLLSPLPPTAFVAKSKSAPLAHEMPAKRKILLSRVHRGWV